MVEKLTKVDTMKGYKIFKDTLMLDNLLRTQP